MNIENVAWDKKDTDHLQEEDDDISDDEAPPADMNSPEGKIKEIVLLRTKLKFAYLYFFFIRYSVEIQEIS